MKFRKKPVVIEAKQLLFENQTEVKNWCGGKIWSRPPMRMVTGISIETLEGTMNAEFGDWIIKGIAGEFYVCKNEIFQNSYEPVKDEV